MELLARSWRIVAPPRCSSDVSGDYRKQVRQMIRDQKQVLDQIHEDFDARPEEIHRTLDTVLRARPRPSRRRIGLTVFTGREDVEPSNLRMQPRDHLGGAREIDAAGWRL
jgi:hypothetical protein